ncbi:MAG TPA: MFS transporter [Acidimicrobiales bacterium]|nr:MFS transporter [Acidimicrobiales bacterium]
MDAATTQHQNQHHSNRWIILGFLGLAQLMVVLDATIANVALPSIQQSLGFSNVDRQWLITAYSLAFGSLLFLGGRLSDLLGRKTTLQLGLVGFAFASALGGAAQSFSMLVAARAIQGAFGAVLAPAALAMVTTAFTDPDERGKAFGIYGSIAGAGAAIGLLLGGILTQYLDWRWCLYVNLIFAGIALVGTQILLVRERGTASGGLDVPSTALISGGLFAIVFGLSNAATKATNDAAAGLHVTLATAFGNATTIACLLGGVALVGVFAWRQTRIEKPMLPMGVILDRARGGSFLSILIAAAAMFATFFFLTFYLQQVHGYSPVRAGLSFLPMIVVLSATAATASTKLLPRLGPRPLVVTGMALGTGGMVILTQLTVTSSYATNVLPGLLVLGMAMGLVFAMSMNTATARVQPEYAGSASATVNVTQQVGGSIGTALLSTVAIAATIAILPNGNLRITPTQLKLFESGAQVHGYTTAFWWAAALFGVGTIVAAAVLPSGRPERVTAEPELVAAV